MRQSLLFALLLLPFALFAQPDEMTICGEEPKLANFAEVWACIPYPPLARDAGIQGTVVFRVLFDAEGEYVRHKLIKTVHPILTQAFEPYVPCLKMVPAIGADGKPTGSWVNVPFRMGPAK